jgi:DNA invertase Pin-like site-specific DNA recombinase
MTPSPPTGREYLRVSKDRTGQARSVTEQADDNQRHAHQRGVHLLDPYAEPKAVGASRYSRKTRAGFAQLVADLKAGGFAAEQLWLWESSRGSRKVSEWVELVEALEQAAVSVYVTSHGRLYDPRVPRDRRSLLEDAVDSEYETGKSSQRTRRAHAALAAAGRPNGAAPFGFIRTYNPATRQGTQTIVADEAAVVREMFTRVAAGESLRAISRDLTDRGIRSRTGKVFTVQYVRRMLLRESYAGLRVHRPADGPATTVAGTWPVIVDRALFERVQRILTDPGRKTRRPGRAVHLLSLIAVCDVCGDGLIAVQHHGAWIYRCRGKGHVTCPEADLDRHVEKVMFAYLARPDVSAKLAAATATGSDLDRVRDEVAAVRAQLDDLYTQVATRRLTPGALAAVEPRLVAQLETLQRQEVELSAPPALVALIRPGRGAPRRWRALAVPARREVARMLLAPDLLGQVRVGRCPVRGQRCPVEERTKFSHG